MPGPRRRKVYKKRTYTKKAPNSGWMSKVNKALSLAKHVAGLVNAEAKDYYAIQGVGAVNYNGTMFTLNGGITPGTGDGQRTGDSIKIKTLTIRGDLTWQTADEIVRIMVVWDKENTVTPANIMQLGVGTNQVVNSPKNDDNYYKSKILLDKRYVMDGDNKKRMFKFVIPINEHVKYNNSTNAIENGNIHIIFYGQQAPATGALAEYISKITFMDN